MNTRTATLELTSRGVSMDADIAKSVITFNFTDKAHGESDDMSATFEDREHLWQGGWAPDKGDKLTARIVCRNWFVEGDEVTLECGEFTCDEPEISGPPDTASIKGVSAFTDTPIRQEEKTKSWENSNLKQVAQDVATRHGLDLYFKGEPISFNRLEQRQESDLAFLQRLAEKNGYNLKVNDGQLTLISGKEADAAASSLTIVRGEDAVSRFSLRSKSADVYEGAQVDYWDAEKKEQVSHTFKPASAPKVTRLLKINQRVEGADEAERLAAGELRTANKRETEGTIDLMGRPDVYAGMVVSLSGWGNFDGEYLVETATHKIDRSGYTTSLSIRQTLDY